MAPEFIATPPETKRSFPAVANASTRVLIVGSLPGEASLACSQYYANPKNQFWRLMEAVVDATLVAATYEERLAALLSAGVGLWDVVRSARRAGSLDANIRESESNDLSGFVLTLPSLRAVVFNGSKASALGRRQLGEAHGLTLLSLPSSSPAHAVPFRDKQLEWNRIRGFLRVEGGGAGM